MPPKDQQYPFYFLADLVQGGHFVAFLCFILKSKQPLDGPRIGFDLLVVFKTKKTHH